MREKAGLNDQLRAPPVRLEPLSQILADERCFIAGFGVADEAVIVLHGPRGAVTRDDDRFRHVLINAGGLAGPADSLLRYDQGRTHLCWLAAQKTTVACGRETRADLGLRS
jgi:hypothetical protein